MRIVRIKLQPAISERLKGLSNNFSIEDPGFTEDIFALFRTKGQGLPSDERLEKMADVISTARKMTRALVFLSLRQRRYVLSELVKLPYFLSLLKQAGDPEAHVARILNHFRKINTKFRQAACLSCQYLGACQFGQLYGKVAADIGKVVDADFDSKVHPQCPDRPQIEATQRMYEAIQQLQQMNGNTIQGAAAAQNTPGGQQYLEAADEAEEEAENFEPEEDTSLDDDSLNLDDPEETAGDIQFAGGGGRGGGGSSFGNKHFAKTQEDFVDRLSASSLQLFELGKILDSMLGSALKGKFLPTQEQSARQTKSNNKTVEEITKIDPSQHAHDNATLDAKAAKNELAVTRQLKPDLKKHLLYCLIDTSASMATVSAPNSHCLLTRGQVASTFGAALVKRVGDEKGIFYSRFFADGVGSLSSARTDAEFSSLVDRIVACDYTGGGTNISSAIIAAISDIQAAKDEVAKAEILLITDMDDSIGVSASSHISKAIQAGIKLNVLDINSAWHSYGNARAVLKQIASKYLRFNGASIDIKGMVELVK